jgi:hypothetical protein
VPIVQYCPVCLRGDHAYLQRGWRFSLEIACFKDGCFLLDGCWRCGALLDPLAQTVPSDAFLCIRCSAPLAGAPSMRVPDSVHDQNVVYATLFHLVVESRQLVSQCGPDSDYISFRERDYVAALSSGDLRGTNPANAAARHDAVMLTAYNQRHPPNPTHATPGATEGQSGRRRDRDGSNKTHAVSDPPARPRSRSGAASGA